MSEGGGKEKEEESGEKERGYLSPGERRITTLGSRSKNIVILSLVYGLMHRGAIYFYFSSLILI